MLHEPCGPDDGRAEDVSILSQARARNEATFRVEDQGGWQPDHVPIDAQQALNTYLCTDLPVSTIAGSVLRSGLNDIAPAQQR